ncbi:hypothetical protein EVAR_64492_1 [Eumeta japonica]|uniref:Uncharacterized protein n=1 Tax=Eumeta variegata TaxID=151549 RepID=A0A4C2A7N4_EUMVA|nr:hypothetical protein EVAR_64492_1 [Eumeta japonica]
MTPTSKIQLATNSRKLTGVVNLYSLQSSWGGGLVPPSPCTPRRWYCPKTPTCLTAVIVCPTADTQKERSFNSENVGRAAEKRSSCQKQY